jgi:HSP20 family molecular chaperone IbpA/ribosomal protein L37E
LQKPYKENTLVFGMFNKKNCKRCGKKISDKYDFCPYCGNSLNKKQDEEEWGLLGKHDFMPPMDGIKFPKGFNLIFNSLIKNLDRQFKNLDREINKEGQERKANKKVRKEGISISISSFGNRPPEIRMQSFGNSSRFKQKEQDAKNQVKEIHLVNFSNDNLKKFSKLPREEPSTNIRRFSDRVVYELKMPGVKSTKDVSITSLENSLEIKAVAKNKSYFKLIPIGLPVINYNLSKGKLILEFGEKN